MPQNATNFNEASTVMTTSIEFWSFYWNFLVSINSISFENSCHNKFPCAFGYQATENKGIKTLDSSRHSSFVRVASSETRPLLMMDVRSRTATRAQSRVDLWRRQRKRPCRHSRCAVRNACLGLRSPYLDQRIFNGFNFISDNISGWLKIQSTKRSKIQSKLTTTKKQAAQYLFVLRKLLKPYIISRRNNSSLFEPKSIF